MNLRFRFGPETEESAPSRLHNPHEPKLGVLFKTHLGVVAVGLYLYLQIRGSFNSVFLEANDMAVVGMR